MIIKVFGIIERFATALQFFGGSLEPHDGVIDHVVLYAKLLRVLLFVSFLFADLNDFVQHECQDYNFVHFHQRVCQQASGHIVRKNDFQVLGVFVEGHYELVHSDQLPEFFIVLEFLPEGADLLIVHFLHFPVVAALQHQLGLLVGE